MIDLGIVKNIMGEAEAIVARLDGQALDERDAVSAQTKGALRQAKAKMSQDLQLLATRLELAAALVRVEYWHARGESDPLHPNREAVE